MSRRSFLGNTAVFAVGMALGAAPVAAGAVTSYKVRGGKVEPELFVSIRPDETVQLVIHRSEMGQQIWTALAQVLVEELDVEWSRIEIKQAEGHPKYGDQNTDGSRSIRNNFDRFRLIGAAMRRMLEQAAAAKWSVPVSEVRAVRGEVIHERTKRRATYGMLAEDAGKLDLPDPKDLSLKPRSEWRSIAKPVKSLITPDIIVGKGTYGQDVRLPDMVYAVIAHPPRVLSAAESVDDKATLAIPGVLQTVTIPAPEPPVHFKPLGGVAVIANDTWSALRGRDALQVKWSTGPNAGYDSEEYSEKLRETVRSPCDVRMKRGDVAKALEGATKRVEAEYYVPHLAHASMEPPAVVARWEGDKVFCWGCIQTPQAARRNVAQVCGVPEDNVTIHVSWLGGGFGRKSKPDFFAEAALLAREVKKPVKVVWTREDDLKHGYLHTVSAQRLEAGLDDNGKCTALLHRTVFPPITSTFVDGATAASWGDLRLGASDTPFDVANFQLESGEAEAHIRIGWLRSVANIYHAFAVQSFASELAHAAGRDAKDYLLELIGPPRFIDPNKDGAKYDNYGSPMDEYPIDTARLAHTVERAAKLAKWGRELPPGHGVGIAAHRSFTSYSATVVEVSVTDRGQLTIEGVWSVIDAGTIVNPNHVKHQVEGGTLFGLSNAMFGEITAKAGEIEQANFPQFRVMRMNEAPRTMEVEIVESTAPPGGVGEPPTPPAAPALANAIFDACGVRCRTLPIFGRDRKDRLPVEGLR